MFALADVWEARRANHPKCSAIQLGSFSWRGGDEEQHDEKQAVVDRLLRICLPSMKELSWKGQFDPHVMIELSPLSSLRSITFWQPDSWQANLGQDDDYNEESFRLLADALERGVAPLVEQVTTHGLRSDGARMIDRLIQEGIWPNLTELEWSIYSHNTYFRGQSCLIVGEDNFHECPMYGFSDMISCCAAQSLRSAMDVVSTGWSH